MNNYLKITFHSHFYNSWQKAIENIIDMGFLKTPTPEEVSLTCTLHTLNIFVDRKCAMESSNIKFIN